MPAVRPAVDLLVAVAVVVGPVLVLRALRRPPAPAPARRRGRSPLVWWAAVTGLLYANQVAVTVYVLRVHGGDPGFVARYLPPGWFAVADGPAWRALAAAVPAPELLAPSVLRVPALLELPFVVLAYLVVLRWLGARAARAAVAGPVPAAACAAYTLVFVLVEAELANPWTGQDVALRVVAGALTAVVLHRAGRGGALRLDGGGPDPDGAGPPGSVVDVLVAVVSAAAFGVLVLVVYDTALLYNLARAPDRLPVAAAAVAVLAAARLLARHRAARPAPAVPPGATARVVGTGLARAAVLFLVPALPVRYGLGFGTPQLAAAAAAVVAAVAAAATLRSVRARGPVPWPGLAAAAAAGTAAAPAALLAPPTYPEARILLASGLFLTAALAAAGAADALRARAVPPVRG